MDRIRLRGIRALGRHGWEAGERERAQPLIIDVRIDADLQVAQVSDDLADTLDYAQLRSRLIATVERTSHALLERLAADLLGVIFEDRRVLRAEVTIAKPGILDGATPSITLERDNPIARQM